MRDAINPPMAVSWRKKMAFRVFYFHFLASVIIKDENTPLQTQSLSSPLHKNSNRISLLCGKSEVLKFLFFLLYLYRCAKKRRMYRMRFTAKLSSKSLRTLISKYWYGLGSGIEWMIRIWTVVNGMLTCYIQGSLY